MKIYLSIGLLVLFVTCNLFSGGINNVEWVSTFGGKGSDETGTLAISKDGSIVFAGTFNSDSVYFGKGFGFNFEQDSLSGLVLVKLDSTGNLKWVKTMKGTEDISPRNIKTDSQGNIVVIANPNQLWKKLDLGDSIVITSHGIWDAILLKFKPDGKCQWAKALSQPLDASVVTDLFIDSTDNIFISGWGGKMDFGNGIKTNNPDMTYFAKFAPDGNCQWVKQILAKDTIHGNIYSAGFFLKQGKDNSINLIGYIGRPTDFGDGKYVNKINTSADGSSIFLANYSKDGAVNWVKLYGDNNPLINTIVITNLKIDNDGNIYICGYFRDNGFFAPGFPLNLYSTKNSGNADIFFVKLNSLGDVLWVKYFGSYLSEWPSSIAIDSRNNIFVSGLTNSSELKLDNKTIYNKYINSQDIFNGTTGFIALFDTSGKCLDLTSIPSNNACVPMRIVIDKKDNLFVSGYFSDTMLVQGSPYVGRNDDVFIAKFNNSCDISSFSMYDFTYESNLKYNQSAQNMGSSIELTPALPVQTGAVWYDIPVPVKNGFTSKFQFRFTNPHNDYDDGSLPGADGIAFVIQNTDAKTYGTTGGGIGFEGISKSIAIEFDTYKNDEKSYNDADGNHIAVFCNGKLPNVSDHKSSANKGTTNKIMKMRADSTTYFAQITYIAATNKLEIYLDTIPTFTKPVLVVDSINISNLLDLNGSTKAIVGFTASTGASYERQDITGWSFCSVPVYSITDINENNIILSGNEPGIYPNPATDFIEISVGVGSEPSLTSDVRIFNVFGQRVNLTPTLSILGEGASLDVSGLASGIYFVRIGDRVIKFVKI